MFFQRITHPFTFDANRRHLMMNIERFLRTLHNSSATSRNKEILLFKIGVTMLQQRTNMQNQLFRIKFTPNATQACVSFRTLPTHSKKNVLNMIKLRFDFRFQKGVAKKPRKRERQNHKLPLSRHFLKFKMSLPVNISHKLSPSFQPIFNFRQEC